MYQTYRPSELPERLINRRDLAGMLGGISMMTLWRREHEPGFPKKIKIGGGVFWRLSEMMTWLDRQATQTEAGEV
ncbi:MAG: AlpA family phage regulatory protein [Rhodospirillaceae bacterium]|jgi:predicted DNA-binding transcriptional regulator AlpA|nr:AlpA family phage regulatory protein [Rhodospirillaceae bacterium]